MFKKKLWALIICLIIAPNLSLASARPKLAVNYDQQHSRVWYKGENLTIYWQVYDFTDQQLLQAYKSLLVVNEAGTHGYSLPAGDFNTQRSGAYNWKIPQDIAPGKYRLAFDLIIPGTWPHQALSSWFIIQNPDKIKRITEK